MLAPWFCPVTTKIWSVGHQCRRCITALRSWTNRVIALRQISVTTLFYLEDSRRIHPRSVRLCQPKDVKRRVEERASLWEREGGGPLAPLFICFPLPLGLPYTNWASQVCCLSYLKSSLRASDLPLTFLCSIFAGVSLPCLLATTILDSCFLFYLTK